MWLQRQSNTLRLKKSIVNAVWDLVPASHHCKPFACSMHYWLLCLKSFSWDSFLFRYSKMQGPKMYCKLKEVFEGMLFTRRPLYSVWEAKLILLNLTNKFYGKVLNLFWKHWLTLTVTVSKWRPMSNPRISSECRQMPIAGYFFPC